MNLQRLAFVVMVVVAPAYGCTEEQVNVTDASPTPVVASVTVTAEMEQAIVQLMSRLPEGERVRPARRIAVSHELGQGVVASAFLGPEGESRVFAADAPAEADMALAYLVAVSRAEGSDSGRVDLREADVARYGVIAMNPSPQQQRRWSSRLAAAMRSGIERELEGGVTVCLEGQ